ncbi:hypothetical protein [Azospirillum sp. B4]|uniref:hypothetical protein n=1 Tax=Azospirillum sp. B4 TaxID=95605 RepID=UPI00034C4372|nr:hypothetical protein [Azospirillum sp. B4]
MAEGHIAQFIMAGEIINVGKFNDAKDVAFFSAQIGCEIVTDDDHTSRVARWIHFYGQAAQTAVDELQKGTRCELTGRLGTQKSGDDFIDTYVVDDQDNIVIKDDRDVAPYPSRDKDNGDGGRAASGRSGNGGGNGRGNGSRGNGSRGGDKGKSASGSGTGGSGGNRGNGDSGGGSRGGRRGDNARP